MLYPYLQLGPGHSLFFFFNIYFIWRYQILVVACEVFVAAWGI